jgi:hypothetical protein
MVAGAGTIVGAAAGGGLGGAVGVGGGLGVCGALVPDAMPGVRVAVGAAIAGTGDAASRSDGLDVTDAPVNADGIDDDAGAPTFTPLVDGDRARVLFTVPHPTSSRQPLRHPTRIIQDIGVFNAALGRASRDRAPFKGPDGAHLASRRPEAARLSSWRSPFVVRQVLC